jgi:allophanate hydrolase subunit 2
MDLPVRPDHCADRLALALGNALVGNPPEAAALPFATAATRNPQD